MKYARVVQLTFFVLVILFVGLYISQMTGYYQYNESRKTTLTQSAIERFEQDVKEGKEIHAGDYLEEETEYNNKISNLGMKISRVIEAGFNKAMNAIFDELSKAISNS